MNSSMDFGSANELKDAARAALAMVSLSEAAAATLDARICLLDAALVRLRTAAEHAGIEVKEPVAVMPSPSTHMDRHELAAEMRVSVRTIDNDRKKMTEGVHYHLHGRRVVFHIPEAKDFLRTLRARLGGKADLEQIAIDEVTQRRAREALKRSRGAR